MPEPTTTAQPQAESHEPQPKRDDQEDEERVVTLSEVLQEESMMAETADAVLGDASDTSCSYALSYIRQVRVHLYSGPGRQGSDRTESVGAVCVSDVYARGSR